MVKLLSCLKCGCASIFMNVLYNYLLNERFWPFKGTLLITWLMQLLLSPHNVATKLRNKMYKSHGMIEAVSYVSCDLNTIGYFDYIRKKLTRHQLRWHFSNAVFETTDLRSLFFNTTEYIKCRVNTYGVKT